MNFSEWRNKENYREMAKKIKELGEEAFNEEYSLEEVIYEILRPYTRVFLAKDERKTIGYATTAEMNGLLSDKIPEEYEANKFIKRNDFDSILKKLKNYFPHEKKFVYIDDIVIAPEYRRKGIGRRFLKFIKSRLGGVGIGFIRLSPMLNLPSVKTASYCGFCFDGEVYKNVYEDEGEYYYLMTISSIPPLQSTGKKVSVMEVERLKRVGNNKILIFNPTELTMEICSIMLDRYPKFGKNKFKKRK